MTAKEKAKELVNRYQDLCIQQLPINGHDIIEVDEIAKQCALIAINEVINSIEILAPFINTEYWNEVKSEITNI